MARIEPKIRLDRELGSGATGRVVHGELSEPFAGHPAGFEVAVKTLRPELERVPQAVTHFELEAKAGVAMRGAQGIVHVLATGRDERGRWLVMPFVPGRTLREELELASPMPEPLWRSVARQLATGLAALHAAGYVHGDVKPENVRLDAEGRALLLDLGFVRRRPSTVSGRNVTPKPGSLAYLSPEEARGEHGGPESDVFALGVVLYELATGYHPFVPLAIAPGGSAPTGPRSLYSLARSGSSGAIGRQALEKPDADRVLAAIAAPRFVAPSRLVPQLSPLLDRILREALARDPAARPTAEELHQRLVDEERGAWWRSVIDFAAEARRSSSAERDAQHLTPLVGREHELELLLDAFERGPGDASAPARSAVIWLEGASGSGKSRLVHEFAAQVRASDDPPLYLYGRCHRLQERRPGQAWLGLLRRYLRLPPDTPVGERERELLASLVPPRVVEALCEALDPAQEGIPTIPLPGAMSRFVIALAKRQPSIVFLDDITWAGGETLRVLAQIIEQMESSRLFLVLGLRQGSQPRQPERLARLRERAAAKLESLEIELGPLDREAVGRLVQSLFDRTVPRLRLARVLWKRSRGNPGLLTELLRAMRARGAAVVDEHSGTWRLSVSPDELPLPDSLSKAIAESYRELPPDDRLWLRRLAVVGGRIDTGFLIDAFPPAQRAEVDDVLARLSRQSWLVPVGSRYRFARPALREMVYGTLKPEQRRRLHRAAALALEPPQGRKPTLDEAFQRAFHLRAAGEHELLLGLLEPLIERLTKSGHPQRVRALAQWGLEAVDALPDSHPEHGRVIGFLEAASDAADRLGDRESQRELLDRLSDLDLDLDLDPRGAGRVYLLHGRYAISTGQYGLARGMLRNAVLLFERADAQAELSEALRRLSAVQAHVGELADARKLARRALETSAHDAQRAVAELALGVLDVLEDKVEPALASTTRALTLLRRAREWNLPGAISAALVLRVRIYRSCGRLDRALASAERAAHLASIAGEKRLEVEASARIGGTLLELGRLPEAEERLREALLLAEEIEDRRGRALTALFLGLLLAANGDHEAADVLERTISLAHETGLNRIEALALAVRARLALAHADTASASGASLRANALLEQFGAELFDRIVIVATRARVLAAEGRRSEAGRLERALRARLKRENERIESRSLRADHKRAALSLFEAARRADGSVYPRPD